jgi:putative oxidoreductase
MLPLMSSLSFLGPYAYGALRIVSGFLFFFHGVQKLFGLFGGREVDVLSRLGAAGVIETAGGILLMLGLGTRLVAIIASGEMAVAYFTAHQPRGGWPIQNGGELAVLYCFLFLYIATQGGGWLSVDGLRGGSARRRG